MPRSSGSNAPGTSRGWKMSNTVSNPRVKHPRKKNFDQVVSCSATTSEVVELDRIADLEGTSRSAIVRRALTAYLRQSPDRQVAS